MYLGSLGASNNANVFSGSVGAREAGVKPDGCPRSVLKYLILICSLDCGRSGCSSLVFYYDGNAAAALRKSDLNTLVRRGEFCSSLNKGSHVHSRQGPDLELRNHALHLQL